MSQSLTHFTFDGFHGHRSRFDDLKLVQELMEELPSQLGLQPVMPPVMFPYYNGMVPEDCGISAFVLLRGGHFTVHTFSFAECLFADLVSPGDFSADMAKAEIEGMFPCKFVTTHTVSRGAGGGPAFMQEDEIDPGADFGPHLFVHFSPYTGPTTMDDLFDLFDKLPERVNMTPIMRPFLVRSPDGAGGTVLSALTMIAESHISLHVFPQTGEAFFDLFSCKFFNTQKVVDTLIESLGGNAQSHFMVSRGCRFKDQRTHREDVLRQVNLWRKGMA